MLRVAKEVRIFPLVDYKNSCRNEVQNLSPLVEAVRERFGGEIVEVGFEFQPGAKRMLCIVR